MVPPVDGINTFQVTDFDITVNNIAFDSLITSTVSYPVVGLGRIANDPFFGATNQGVYFQVIPPVGSFTFPDDAIIDSTVIGIPFLGKIYGDTNRSNTANALHLKAYEIAETFPYTVSGLNYYSFSKLAYNPTPIASGTITVQQLYDTLKLANGDTFVNQLRLRADALNTRFKNFTASELYSFDQFLNAFKGIYIAPDTTVNSNSIGYFAINNANTGNYGNAQIEVYYHMASDTTLRRAFFKFQQLSCSFFNSINRRYAGMPVTNYLNNPTASSDSLVIQSYPGLHSTLNIKLDDKIPESVINKAELTITALKTSANDMDFAPNQLVILVVEPNGYERYLSDMRNADSSVNTSGQIFVDGNAKTVMINGQEHWQYKFNLPREIQRAVLVAEKELKLKVSAPRNFPGAYRMIGAGPNHSLENARLKLDIVYTKLNK